MVKRNLLLSLVIVITLLGGFFIGVIYSEKSTHKESSHKTRLEINPMPKSETKPEPKQIPKPAKSKVLIGYVQDFRNPSVVDYSKLTHVIFSFAHPAKDGRVLLNGKMAVDNLKAMTAKAHQQNTKIMLAVGGWYHIQGGESYPYFKAAITNPSARAKLIRGLVNITEREKLDGIDIDFEHPRSQADAENLDIFIKSLSSRLHAKKKELSIAVHPKIHSVTKTEIHFVVYKPEMFQYVDHVNIMAYDGQWDGGYNASNLSPYPFTEKIVNYWDHLFENYKLPKEKLVLGVPLYGQPDNPAIKQVSYAAILHNNPANAVHDTVAMNGTTYHYNSQLTMQRKTKLALDHGFGGMMLWETGLDATGQGSVTATISNVLKSSDRNKERFYTDAKR